MRLAVLGTGGVGQTLAAKVSSLGHEVMMGTRDVQESLARTETGWGAIPLSQWQAEHPDVKLGTFAEAAAHAEVIFNAVLGTGTLDARKSAGEENLDGKVLIDAANPLDSSRGMPPTLFVANDDSLGNQIQLSGNEGRRRSTAPPPPGNSL
jgi:8-hydroxy-5-deazaflavin:NADPH oxidoreductase